MCTTATGEDQSLLQRAPGVKSAQWATQVHSVLCSGGQEDRYDPHFNFLALKDPFTLTYTHDIAADIACDIKSLTQHQTFSFILYQITAVMGKSN